MASANAATTSSVERTMPMLRQDATRSSAGAVSWGAIVAGAVAAAALSLILLILGTGLGLSSASPWTDNGVSATTFGISAILWLTLTQLIASGMGGYLAGRLRVKWVEVHADDVYFRDTAHGFLAWAVASLVTASLLTSVIGSIVSGDVKVGASVAAGVTTAGADLAKVGAGSGSMNYFVDSLFRKDIAAPGSASGSVAGGAMPESATAASTVEMVRIFTNSVRSGALPTEDVRYAAQIVAQRTGLSPQDAEKRVNDTYARARQQLHSAETAAKNAADKAREASAYAALWLFISLLAGAFVASLAATFGGRQRDD